MCIIIIAINMSLERGFMTSICIKDNNQNVLNSIISDLNKCELEGIIHVQKKFKIYENLIIHYCGNEIDKFYDSISKIIASSIFKIYESKIIQRQIRFDYFYFSKDEVKVIKDEYNLISQNEDKKIKENLVNNKIMEYIKQNNSIILEGFVQFRLYDYKNYISIKLQEAVNQFVIDKEYFDFINLLKSYVDSKVPENLSLNLIYVNSEAILLSEDGLPIKLENFNCIYVSDITFSNNDYVLNTLVGLLPRQIIIHLISKEDQFINTVKLIFSDRVKICKSCSICNVYRSIESKQK